MKKFPHLNKVHNNKKFVAKIKRWILLNERNERNFLHLGSLGTPKGIWFEVYEPEEVLP